MLRQLCDDTSDTILIENSAVTQKWVATYIGVTPLFSMKAVWLASLQHWWSFGVDFQCKRALTRVTAPDSSSRSGDEKCLGDTTIGIWNSRSAVSIASRQFFSLQRQTRSVSDGYGHHDSVSEELQALLKEAGSD